MTEPLLLHEDRFFDPDPAIRRAARSLYEETRDLPLVCPHGHVDANLLAENASFSEPTQLIITPDHYIIRMLYSRGIGMETLGVLRSDGGRVARDPRQIWQVFGEHYYLFRGTPTGVWIDHELHELFGIRIKLDAESAQTIYDEIARQLAKPEFRPRALFDRFKIEVLSTTDKGTDRLDAHRAIRESGWRGNVIPTFRPDALMRIAGNAWRNELTDLERVHDDAIDSFGDFIQALEARRAFFKTMGAVATDHGVVEPYTERLSPTEMDQLFQRAKQGSATPADQRRFEAHMLIEMARMSVDDGLVMQLHAGSFRDHNRLVFDRYGTDKGGDIPVTTEYTRNLRALLDEFGNDPGLTLVLFTLDESAYARELAPLAGHYPAVRLGPPWWFHDSIEGMTRFRQQTTETAGLYNTAGFNDDTRAFCSIPARHDLSRRVDANFLGGLVARHVVDMSDARRMAHALAYDLVKETYKLGSPTLARPPQAHGALVSSSSTASS
ncbi:MAG TPA: glucuronate isomerase [Gemmatimonadaceae bacterium]|nr:glucuronate isomerase [Gemmatimonadaceae bacterium]